MSYVIHLFEHPGPATLAEAVALHERLSGTRAGPNQRMRRWAQGMQARFPEGHEGWSENPPDGDTDGWAVLSVGLTSGAQRQVLPAAVSLALPLGLCVLDEQAGRCYLPGGWALTHGGRFALQPIRDEAPAPGAPARLEIGGWQWTQHKLLQRMGPALAAHGFKGGARASRLRFARIVPMGFQSLNLTLRDGPRVEPAVYLEPVLPHALYKAVRPGRTLSCHTHNLEPLQRFGAQAEPAPGRAPWYRLSCSPHEIDAFADALVQWTLANILPLFDACQDLPGILRCHSQRHETALPAFVNNGRTMLALKHWVHGGELDADARQLAVEDGVQAEIPLRTARALRALPEWEASWRPLRAPCRHYEFQQAVTAPALAAAAFAPLRRVAESHGFAVIEEGPLCVQLRRQSAEVVQTLELQVKPRTISGAELKVSARWEAPALTAHWRSSWPGAAGMQEAGGWQDRRPSYFWMPGTLRAAGIDDLDLSVQFDWPDQMEDHVRHAEQSLRQWCEQLLDPALSWQGLARQLPTVEDMALWANQYWMSSFLTRLELDDWITLLLLACLYRTDAPSYAAAMRATSRDLSPIEPLLALIERLG